MPGDIPELNGYSSFELVGRGGQAKVFKAWNTRLSRFEAIKVYTGRPDALNKKSTFQRFQHEARMAAGADFPTVVSIYQAAEDQEGVPCLMMQYVPSRGLRDVIAPLAHRLSDKTIVKIGRDIAGALDYLASREVLHNDVKPDNILIEVEPNKPEITSEKDGTQTVSIQRALLTDFGIASELSSGLTLYTGGTAAYVAPERKQGYPCAQSDQYSLACTLYELFTGRHYQKLEGIPLKKDPRCPSLYDPSLTKIDSVFIKALAEDPSERFATSSEFIDELEIALGLAKLPPHIRFKRFAHKHPLRASAAIAGVLVLVAGLTFAGVASATDVRKLVYPQLGRPGLIGTECPDSLYEGFSRDSGFEETSEYNDLDSVIYEDDGAGNLKLITRSYGWSNRHKPDYRLNQMEFRLGPLGRYKDVDTPLPTSTFFRTPQCRYLQNTDDPISGAVLNVMPQSHQEVALNLMVPFHDQFPDLADRGLVTIGLDSFHRTQFREYSGATSQYRYCIARLSGASSSDSAPWLFVHQYQTVSEDPCISLRKAVQSLVKKAWTSDKAAAGQGDAVALGDPSALERLRKQARVTPPKLCQDLSALGFETIGPAEEVFLQPRTGTFPEKLSFGSPEKIQVREEDYEGAQGCMYKHSRTGIVAGAFLVPQALFSKWARITTQEPSPGVRYGGALHHGFARTGGEDTAFQRSATDTSLKAYYFYTKVEMSTIPAWMVKEYTFSDLTKEDLALYLTGCFNALYVNAVFGNTQDGYLRLWSPHQL